MTLLGHGTNVFAPSRGGPHCKLHSEKGIWTLYLRNIRRRKIFNENVPAAVGMKAGRKDVSPGDG